VTIAFIALFREAPTDAMIAEAITHHFESGAWRLGRMGSAHDFHRALGHKHVHDGFMQTFRHEHGNFSFVAHGGQKEPDFFLPTVRPCARKIYFFATKECPRQDAAEEEIGDVPYSERSFKRRCCARYSVKCLCENVCR